MIQCLAKCFLSVVLISVVYSVQIDVKDNTSVPNSVTRCKPVTVVAHRGASGYVPEHTLAAYALAIIMGADYVEPDLIMTKDGILISRHDNELSLTTDVAQHPEFALRRRTESIDGNNVTGWFSEDFTLAEIKTLRARERIMNNRPGNARLDGVFEVPTFQEIIDLVKALEISQNRRIGIFPEIKHSTHFNSLGLAIEAPLVRVLEKNGYFGSNASLYIQSFEISNLKLLKNLTSVRLLQLYDDKGKIPYDQVKFGSNITYATMATPEGLREVATYAFAVGPSKNYIILRDKSDRLGNVTTFVHDAHAAGLKVIPYAFRAENTFLPAEFRSTDSSEAAVGDLAGELRAFLATGIDGVFADHPDKPAKLRGPCTNL